MKINVQGSKLGMEQNRDLRERIWRIKLWLDQLQLEISRDWSKPESCAWSQIKAFLMYFKTIVPRKNYLNNISVKKQSDNKVWSNHDLVQSAIFRKWASQPKGQTSTKIMFLRPFLCKRVNVSKLSIIWALGDGVESNILGVRAK